MNLSLKLPEWNLKKGIIAIVIAALMMSFQAISVREAQVTIAIPWIIFARYLFGFLIIVATTPPRLIRTKYQKGQLKYYIVRIGSSFAGHYCFFLALKSIPLSTATLLLFSFPIFVPIVAHYWGGMKLVHKIWWGLGIAFVGIIFLLHPTLQGFRVMVLVSLLSGVLGSFSVVSLQSLRVHENSGWLMFITYAIGTVIAAIISLFFLDEVSNVFTMRALIWLSAVALFAALFQYLLTFASRFAPMSLLSPFLYTSFIFGAFLDFFVYHSGISWSAYLGFALITVGTILLVIQHPTQTKE